MANDTVICVVLKIIYGMANDTVICVVLKIIWLVDFSGMLCFWKRDGFYSPKLIKDLLKIIIIKGILLFLPLLEGGSLTFVLLLDILFCHWLALSLF